MLAILAILLTASPYSCGTPDRQRAVAPHHYIFFRRDRERIADTTFLREPNIAGAQLTYTWRELEPQAGLYAFDAVRQDLAFLQAHGKRLFIQLQDVSFSTAMVTPDYLGVDSAYHGGIAAKYEATEDGPIEFGGWVARRWDPAVRERFARLLQALAAEFDGRIEGIVLPETAVGFEDPARQPAGFSPETYAAGIEATLSAGRAAFQRSCLILYANFMPGGRRLLWRVHAYAAAIGAGVGGPDILPYRPFQRLNSLPMIEERPPDVIAGMAVQDGNLADRSRDTGQRISVAYLYAFAVQHLRLNYIFWGTEEPYYTAEVLPFLRGLDGR